MTEAALPAKSQASDFHDLLSKHQKSRFLETGAVRSGDQFLRNADFFEKEDRVVS